MSTLRLKNLMSVRTFRKLAVPRQAITSVPLGTHPSAHCTQPIRQVSKVLSQVESSVCIGGIGRQASTRAHV